MRAHIRTAMRITEQRVCYMDPRGETEVIRLGGKNHIHRVASAAQHQQLKRFVSVRPWARKASASRWPVPALSAPLLTWGFTM